MKTINFEKYNLNDDKIFSAMGEMFNASIELAEEACDSVGTWSAIRLVHTYEKGNFG